MGKRSPAIERVMEPDPWDEVVEDSFPASDPPPGPGILGGPPWREGDQGEAEVRAGRP
jgi:hypothetical protein